MGLWRSASPTPVLKAESARAGFLRAVPHDILNISRHGEFTASRQSVPMSDHHHSKNGGFFCIKWNFLCLNLGPLTLVLSLGIPQKSLALVYTHWQDPLEDFLFEAEQSQLSQTLLTRLPQTGSSLNIQPYHEAALLLKGKQLAYSKIGASFSSVAIISLFPSQPEEL